MWFGYYLSDPAISEIGSMMIDPKQTPEMGEVSQLGSSMMGEPDKEHSRCRMQLSHWHSRLPHLLGHFDKLSDLRLLRKRLEKMAELVSLEIQSRQMPDLNRWRDWDLNEIVQWMCLIRDGHFERGYDLRHNSQLTVDRLTQLGVQNGSDLRFVSRRNLQQLGILKIRDRVLLFKELQLLVIRGLPSNADCKSNHDTDDDDEELQRLSEAMDRRVNDCEVAAGDAAQSALERAKRNRWKAPPRKKRARRAHDDVGFAIESSGIASVTTSVGVSPSVRDEEDSEVHSELLDPVAMGAMIGETILTPSISRVSAMSTSSDPLLQHPGLPLPPAMPAIKQDDSLTKFPFIDEQTSSDETAVSADEPRRSAKTSKDRMRQAHGAQASSTCRNGTIDVFAMPPIVPSLPSDPGSNHPEWEDCEESCHADISPVFGGQRSIADRSCEVLRLGDTEIIRSARGEGET